MNTKLFVSPHNDDAVLFGAFTLLREKPMVLTVFDSFVQVDRGYPECNADARRAEDVKAVSVCLGCAIHSGYVPDNLTKAAAAPKVYEVLSMWRRMPEVWLPAVEGAGNEQHNLVGELGLEIFKGAKIHRYLTYTRTGGKSTGGTLVTPDGPMVLKKLQALACYRTQLQINALGCWPHFLRDQYEYVLD
jgi:hypothetical protein